MGFSRARILPQHNLKKFNGPIYVSLLLKSNAQRVLGIHVVRLQLISDFQFRNGLF